MRKIVVENVSLVYRVGLNLSLKGVMLDMVRLRRRTRTLPTVRALDGVSLHVQEGERLGIIGRNGAGKSTLLKVMAGLLPPTEGKVRQNGRISCLFEVATGFEMNSSGWDNIWLRGLLLGATPAEIRAREKEIAEFTELGEFLDLPVRCYSSGMFVRLAFSISTAFDPEILLLDEVIAAGDQKFYAKAKERIKQLIDRAAMMVLVSHSLGTIEELCTRAIWLEKGRIVQDGEPLPVIRAYKSYCDTGRLPGDAA